MVGVLIVGFVANLLIRPVDERFHEPGEEAGRDERFVRDGAAGDGLAHAQHDDDAGAQS